MGDRVRAEGAVVKREPGGFWVNLAVVVFYPLCTALAARRYRHAGRLPGPGAGPAILVMNHISYFDPPFDAVFVHRQRRVPRFLAKDTLWHKPLLGTLMAGSGQIPVYRGSLDARNSLAEADRALREGKIVVFYPEGTITKDPNGWPMRSFSGLGKIALDNPDVPVIPAARWGTLDIFDARKRRVRFFPRTVVTTVTGEPIDFSEYRGEEVTNKAAREVTERVMMRIMELLGEIRGEQPPERLYRPRSGRKPQGD
jgi:1-acyl-sn-glycerol-3-phosphate acyltransferase